MAEIKTREWRAFNREAEANRFIDSLPPESEPFVQTEPYPYGEQHFWRVYFTPSVADSVADRNGESERGTK